MSDEATKNPSALHAAGSVPGMTLRAYLAGQALVLAGAHTSPEIAKRAVAIADAVIAELNAGEGPPGRF